MQELSGGFCFGGGGRMPDGGFCLTTRLLQRLVERWEYARFGCPGCTAATPGKIPSAQEVDYAIYLLTGKTPLGAKNFKNPRWTLNDGK